MAQSEIMMSDPDRMSGPELAYWFRLTLVLAWVILAAGVVGIGERRGSFEDLDEGLDAGRIHNVSVHGAGIDPGGTGPVTQTVHWAAGGRHRVTKVKVRTPAATTTTDEDDTRPGMVITGTDVGAYLQDRHPQLLVTRSSQAEYDLEYLGWKLPLWLFLPGLLVRLGVLGLVIGGPEPWRATRWAWFWLSLNPIGLPAYLLLSGPTPLIRAPRRIERRLTGGWALLLSLILPG